MSNEQPDSQSPDRTQPRLIQDEMKQSYLDYSMSVIVGRALPDVRDGLKPVHRRILYAMHDMGMLHNKPFKKSARIVGEVLGKYHPHGDSAVYDSMVRMAQEWSLRYQLINGQGNFGSIDGDRQAAMRYTEAKLKKIAEEMLQDIDKETVDFGPNFDTSLKEPLVLPSKLPNLLINGSSGIAVGMATNIPPHNMAEVAQGMCELIDNPEVSIEQLSTVIKGPDFPTGGIICGQNGIKNAYATGRGRVIVRAKIGVEEGSSRQHLIVSEIPYMVNKAETIEEIARLVTDKKILGIHDLRDESDKDGMRVVIELKKDADPEVVKNQLFSHTRLQTTFGTIMLALVEGVPKVLNLKQLLSEFLSHRKSVVTKRTTYDLAKAKARAHIVEGLLTALGKINDVIKLIRGSKSGDEAKQGLISQFSLSEEQAKAILDMRLQRLTGLEQDKLKAEHKELQELITHLQSILDDPQKVLDIIKKEMQQLMDSYGDPRRTEISDHEMSQLNMEDLIEQEDMVVTVTKSGYIKRISLDEYKQQQRGGKGVIGATAKDEDVVDKLFVANTHSYILYFTNKGKVHWLKTYHLPQAGRQARGKAIVNLLQLEQDEVVTAFVPIAEFDDTHYLIMATRNGVVKKTNLLAYSNPRKAGIIAITLDAGDQLMDVHLTDGTEEIILATKNGAAVRFKEDGVRSTGRSARGVRGISLKKDDEVVGMVVAADSETILSITENGFGKRTKVSEYRLTNRGGTGVINIQCSDRNGQVASIASVVDTDQVMVMSKKGITIRIPVSGISIIGRNTQGFRIMKLGAGDTVVSATKISNEELESVKPVEASDPKIDPQSEESPKKDPEPEEKLAEEPTDDSGESVDVDPDMMDAMK